MFHPVGHSLVIVVIKVERRRRGDDVLLSQRWGRLLGGCDFRRPDRWGRGWRSQRQCGGPDLRSADILDQIDVQVDENDDKRRRVPHGRLHIFSSTVGFDRITTDK